MAEKVKVSREVADAIEFLKTEDWPFRSVMGVLINGGFNCVKEASILNVVSTETVARAFLNGYEIEETSEEILLKNYKGARVPLGYYNNFNSGVRFAIDTLGIKIKGINK